MISVVTLTYKRYHILEEAIQSFILQNRDDCEMVIINDAKEVTYSLKNPLPNIRIINTPNRFNCIFSKLNYAFSIAKYDLMYRLDDDDLINKNGLNEAIKSITQNPGYDIYRSDKHVFFQNNEYLHQSSNVNTGNIYSKNYIKRVPQRTSSFGEDAYLTFENRAKIFTIDYPTMIYRWGMNTYHISGFGNVDSSVSFAKIDTMVEEGGHIELVPRFKQDYYSKVK